MLIEKPEIEVKMTFSTLNMDIINDDETERSSLTIKLLLDDIGEFMQELEDQIYMSHTRHVKLPNL